MREAAPPPATLFQQALSAHRAGKLSAAATAYEQLIAVTSARQPEHRAALGNLGALRLSQGDAADADRLFEAALNLASNDAGLLDNRGAALKALGRLSEAAEYHRRAIAADPGKASAYGNLGICLTAQGDLGGALRCLERATALAPAVAEPWHNLGVAREGLGDLRAAIQAYRRALAADPGFLPAWINLGTTLDAVGDAVGAVAAYDSGLALAPSDAKLRWNRSQSLLGLGRYAEGWADFEWRWSGNASMAAQRRPFAMPLWDGQDLGGAPLLVHSEQGWGDTLQMLRFLAPAAHAAGGPLIVETRAELIRLIASSLPLLGLDSPPTLLPLAGDFPGIAGLPDAGAHVPMMSLPGRLGITLDRLPGAPVPYLRAPEDSRRRWAERIATKRGEVAIGLVWQGNPGHWNDRRRSLTPSLLAPLLHRPGIAWFSLQKDADPALVETLGLVPLGDALTDFAETAAAIDALDLVIAVDTSVAHLSAALGKPTWLLLPHVAEWRWMQTRSDSPWYPSMRLFRQPASGDWPAVVAAVGQALDALQT
ncbi:tetratricopeptide repeat protein [Nitrospirillum iridis]|uniref:Tetratricopeptide (TPR) repeat protein n=1 Tax=Nitrospirillum iridis TaxID=765888 RepID=A0A7X0ATV5_9PROT|nr:tetratricopeptide repeat protein [Nitrospirillum iridis]MBB6249963.1 tetratricopeptide (TPR) repeat protein [Nitrospirillum iridis]